MVKNLILQLNSDLILFLFIYKGIIMKISILLVNVHQNQMNQNENQVKHMYHVMNMIEEVVELMVIKILCLLIN